MRVQLIKCKKCRRPFSELADCCPDCGYRSPRAALQGILKVASIIVATIALGTAITLTVTHFPGREVRRDPNAARTPLPPAEDGADDAISFTPR